jgi:hypothetical protein
MDKKYDPQHPSYLFEREHDRTVDLDEEDKNILGEFRQKYLKYHFSDNLLLRFLTSRK